MKFIDQTKFHTSNSCGNCVAACVATLLDYPISELPDKLCYTSELFCWAENNGYELRYSSDINEVESVLFIANGISPRDKTIRHAVIWSKSGIVFDPHPDRAGLVGEPDRYIWFVEKDGE